MMTHDAASAWPVGPAAAAESARRRAAGPSLTSQLTSSAVKDSEPEPGPALRLSESRGQSRVAGGPGQPGPLRRVGGRRPGSQRRGHDRTVAAVTVTARLSPGPTVPADAAWQIMMLGPSHGNRRGAAIRLGDPVPSQAGVRLRLACHRSESGLGVLP